MKTATLLLAVVSLSLAPAAPLSIEKVYSCSGATAAGKYTLGLNVVQKGENYFLNWTKANATVQHGMGLRVDNNLSVVFIDPTTNGLGVILYQIADGELTGKWAGGDGKIYTEDCVVGPVIEQPTQQPANSRSL